MGHDTWVTWVVASWVTAIDQFAALILTQPIGQMNCISGQVDLIDFQGQAVDEVNLPHDSVTSHSLSIRSSHKVLYSTTY